MSRHSRGAIALVFLLCWTAQGSVLAPAARSEEKSDAWEFKWKNGFQLNSPDGQFKLKFGGRINLDFSFADTDAAVEGLLGPIEDGNEFRRARLVFSGTIYNNVEFKAEYDFAGGSADFTDIYLGLRETPVGNIRIGHFFEPFSIEQHTQHQVHHVLGARLAERLRASAKRRHHVP